MIAIACMTYGPLDVWQCLIAGQALGGRHRCKVRGLTQPVAFPWCHPTEGVLTGSAGSTQPEAGSQRRDESRVLAHLTISTVSNWPHPFETGSSVSHRELEGWSQYGHARWVNQ